MWRASLELINPIGLSCKPGDQVQVALVVHDRYSLAGNCCMNGNVTPGATSLPVKTCGGAHVKLTLRETATRSSG